MTSFLNTLAAAALSVSVAGAALAAGVSVTPSTDLGALKVGDSFTLDLTTANDFPDLQGGAFGMTYDPVKLLYLGAEFFPPLSTLKNDQLNQRDQTPGADGRITIDRISFGAFFATTGGGATTLMALQFRARAAGESEITFHDSDITGFLTPAPQGQMVGNRIAVEFDGPLSVTVAGDTMAPVPLPAGGLLLGAALMGFATLRRKAA